MVRTIHDTRHTKRGLMRKLCCLVLLSFIVIAPVWAAQGYVVDKVHSSIDFSILHLMISKTTGSFTDYDGEIVFSPDDLENSRFDFTVKAASIDTRNEMRDNHLRSADFFEAEKYPTISFKTKKVV